MSKRVSVIAAVAVLWGCVSTAPVDYYTLVMERSGRAEAAVNVVVERLGVSEPLARAAILIQSAPTRVEYYADARWAGGLGELVQRKLTLELGPAVDGRETLVLSGTILAFEQVDTPGGPQARAGIRVELRGADAKRYEEPLLVTTYRATRPAEGPAPASVVEALSACVEEIAAQIACDAAEAL